jgi:tetrahydromethanopterin S-methyltransferase subunit A
LIEPLAPVAGVAIAGQVYTANLGIERIVVNVTSNPAIRFLLLCGKDSKLFRPGQSLSALVDNGIDPEARIVGGDGYDPILSTLSPAHVDLFRRQIELVDYSGEEDIDTLKVHIMSLAARDPGRFSRERGASDAYTAEPSEPERFLPIRPGGRREPLQYDPQGYFVITLDRAEEQIVLRHYRPDHTPAHEMRGRLAASMLLGLVREGLISQLSHAGYLGEELAKAQAALTLDLRYDQDRPLRRIPPKSAQLDETGDPATDTAAKPPPMPRVAPPLTLAQFSAASEGEVLSAVLQVTKQTFESEFVGTFLQPSERDPFSSFQRTDHLLTFSTTSDTKTVMGAPSDVVPEAIVRVQGVLRPGNHIDAHVVVVLTNVATVQ